MKSLSFWVGLIFIFLFLNACDSDSDSDTNTVADNYLLLKSDIALYALNPTPPFETIKVAGNPAPNDHYIVGAVHPPAKLGESKQAPSYAYYVENGQLQLLNLAIDGGLATTQVSNLSISSAICDLILAAPQYVFDLKNAQVGVFYPNSAGTGCAAQGELVNLGMGPNDISSSVDLALFNRASFVASVKYESELAVSSDEYFLEFSNGDVTLTSKRDSSLSKTLARNLSNINPINMFSAYTKYSSSETSTLYTGLYFESGGSLYVLDGTNPSIKNLGALQQGFYSSRQGVAVHDINGILTAIFVDNGDVKHISAYDGNYQLYTYPNLHLPLDSELVGSMNSYYMLSRSGNNLISYDLFNAKPFPILASYTNQSVHATSNYVAIVDETGSSPSNLQITDYKGNHVSAPYVEKVTTARKYEADWNGHLLLLNDDGSYKVVTLFDVEYPSKSIVLGIFPIAEYPYTGVQRELRILPGGQIVWGMERNSTSGSDLFVTDPNDGSVTPIPIDDAGLGFAIVN